MLYPYQLHQHDLDETGFSLLETLIALAIMSLASLALFQSSTSMLRTSDRAVEVGEDIIDRALTRHHIQILIAQLVPAWLGTDEQVFIGNGREFSGMSRALFDVGGGGVAPFNLRLENDTQDKMKLVYRLGDQIWDVQSNLPASSNFQYMTPTYDWISIWPPKPANSFTRGETESESLELYNLKLPYAIQLLDQDDLVIWISKVPDFQNDLERFE